MTAVHIRSGLFQVAFYVNFAAFCAFGLPFLIAPRRLGVPALRLWALVSQQLLRLICGVSYEVRGQANLPDGPALIASKHQSHWETLAFLHILDDPAIVLKHELARVPVFGWYALKFGNIAVDRSGGPNALRHLLQAARAVIAQGRQIVIFPEGTRRPPGAAPAYQRGVAGLYRGLGVACVPVALNSGEHLPSPGWLIYPGRIVVEFGEAIAPGLDGAAFLAALEERIEPACARLAAGAECGESLEQAIA